ncbi:transcriptional regulator [Candidatus Woesearchaeota archaeon]|nr:transcriptional regulator [Candidatus Woesearchaeota archaeon]
MVEMPQEIEVWYVIPTIRRELSKNMKASGLTQRRIARLLGITEAAVSQYLKHKRAKGIEFGDSLKEHIAASAKAILGGADPLSEIQRICGRIRKNKTLCEIHRKYSKVPRNCEVCFQ